MLFVCWFSFQTMLARLEQQPKDNDKRRITSGASAREARQRSTMGKKNW